MQQPITDEKLHSLFDHLNEHIAVHICKDGSMGTAFCDGTHKLTYQWAAREKMYVKGTRKLVKFLEKHGGFCDCQSLTNTERHLFHNHIPRSKSPINQSTSGRLPRSAPAPSARHRASRTASGATAPTTSAPASAWASVSKAGHAITARGSNFCFTQ